MNRLYGILLLFVTLMLCGCRQAEEPVHDGVLKSPDGTIQVTLSQSPSGPLMYKMMRNNKAVIEASPLGVVFDDADFCKIDHYKFKAMISLPDGYRAYIYEMHRGENRLDVIFKLSNSGAAFRYKDPQDQSRKVISECTSWTLPAKSNTWFFERKSAWKLKSYAGYWITAPVENLPEVSKRGPVQGNPLLFELPDAGGYALLSEAALIDYSGLRYEAIGGNRLVANFTEGDKGFKTDTGYKSPWRFVLSVDSLDELVNQTMVYDLSPEPDSTIYANTNWLRPGKAVWHWWCCRLGTPEQEREMIDAAAQLGFEHSIIDDGWKDWPQPWETAAKLARFGDSKNVDVWVWSDSKDLKDPANDWDQMKSWLDKVQAAGLSGIKIDFMNSEDHQTIKFMLTLLEESAKREIMVNFHGSNASQGEAKTFPNEMTREGVRGLELNYIREGPITADHNAALPFTRFVLGHADYTPIGFTQPGPTTWAHQLATLVSFTSPLQVIAEDPRFLLRHPLMKEVRPVLKDMPTVWDETRVLNGSAIGDLSLLARRSGEVWYVGALNGKGKRQQDVDLSFLGGGDYSLTAFVDDIEGGKIEVTASDPRKEGAKQIKVLPFKHVHQASLKASNTPQSYSLNMSKGGGAVLILKPIK